MISRHSLTNSISYTFTLLHVLLLLHIQQEGSAPSIYLRLANLLTSGLSLLRMLFVFPPELLKLFWQVSISVTFLQFYDIVLKINTGDSASDL